MLPQSLLRISGLIWLFVMFGYGLKMLILVVNKHHLNGHYLKKVCIDLATFFLRWCHLHSVPKYTLLLFCVGFWSAWTPWSACSANCGFGTNSRSRVQSCTGDNERATRPCQRTPCAIWGGWSTWGACSASCGPGTSVR